MPGAKVSAEIAGIRGIPQGVDSISPNRQLAVNSPAELLDYIARVRTVAGKSTGFKAVIGAYGWLDELCQMIKRRGIESAPDFITIDRADGGTGAATAQLQTLPPSDRRWLIHPAGGSVCIVKVWGFLAPPFGKRVHDRLQKDHAKKNRVS